MDPNIHEGSGDSSPGLEYESALAALEDRGIFLIVRIEGGFELREMGSDQNFVRLLPEQLAKLGEEMITLATTAMTQEATVQPPLPPLEPPPAPANHPSDASPAATRGKTITIPPGIWNMRVTEELSSRISRLEQADPIKVTVPPNKVKPWIKPT